MKVFWLTTICFAIMLLFGIIFSGIVGGFIGGLVAGLFARGISKGLAASFFGGVFGASLIAFVELFGFILFDETFVGRLFRFSGDVFLGLIIILAFFGILSSVLGGFVGGIFGRLFRRSKFAECWRHVLWDRMLVEMRGSIDMYIVFTFFVLSIYSLLFIWSNI